MASSKITDTLIRFANDRERAFRAANMLTMEKAKAISKIRTVAGFFKGKKPEVQLRAVTQLEYQLTVILPHPGSRYHRLREKILNLIDSAHDSSTTDQQTA